MLRANDKHQIPSGLAGNPTAFYPRLRTIFSQGDSADTVFYILEGTVRLSISSKDGKEAILAILGERDFFGEGALAGQAFRIESASAMTPCHLLCISKKAMTLALHRERVSDLFIACLLAQNIQYAENFVDQCFNYSEKRLARILLLLTRSGRVGEPATEMLNISQGTLAAMVGTTRSRVNLFMNRFRALGFINYGKDGIQVHRSLLNFVLKD